MATDGSTHRYYEWLPMMAAGVQFATGSCRILPLARGGGALGNIAMSGLFPGAGFGYGVGGNLNCLSVDLAINATRVLSQDTTTDLWTADLSYRFWPSPLKIGLRGEAELGRAAGQSAALLSPALGGDRTEERVLVVLRTDLSGS